MTQSIRQRFRCVFMSLKCNSNGINDEISKTVNMSLEKKFPALLRFCDVVIAVAVAVALALFTLYPAIRKNSMANKQSQDKSSQYIY